MNSGTIVTPPPHPLAEPVPDQPLPLLTDALSAIADSDRLLSDCRQWLSAHPVWGQLPTDALQAIAQSLYCFYVEPQTLIYQEGQAPIGLYLLKFGTVEIFRRSPLGKSLIRYRNAGDLFGYTLVANAAEGVYQTSAIALTASKIGFLPQAAFQTLIVDYPAIQQVIHSLISQDLHEYAARIAWEQVRIQGLRSYIHSVPGETSLLGSSKAAKKL
ncbi:MAG TPA: cyclic nucleotide-binding domain-containing protein, partial [Crinalium sp.]